MSEVESMEIGFNYYYCTFTCNVKCEFLREMGSIVPFMSCTLKGGLKWNT